MLWNMSNGLKRIRKNYALMVVGMPVLQQMISDASTSIIALIDY
jgi:hypothetical protein